MQNKPNFREAQMNANSIITNDYGNESAFRARENKANQTQFPWGAKTDAKFFAEKGL